MKVMTSSKLFSPKLTLCFWERNCHFNDNFETITVKLFSCRVFI
jgi:hypothetical protein